MQQEQRDQVEEKKIDANEEFELNELRAMVVLTDEQVRQVGGGPIARNRCW